jgi:hypothetical protein
MLFPIAAALPLTAARPLASALASALASTLTALAFATLAANLRHVLSILAHRLTSLACDLALLLLVHRGEAPLTLAAAGPLPALATLTTLAAT